MRSNINLHFGRGHFQVSPSVGQLRGPEGRQALENAAQAQDAQIEALQDIVHIAVDSHSFQEAENLWFPVAEHPSRGRGYHEGDNVDIAHIRLQPPGEPEMTPRGILTWMATHPPALETCLIRKNGQADAAFLQDVWRAAGRFCKQYGQQILEPLGDDALTLSPSQRLH